MAIRYTPAACLGALLLLALLAMPATGQSVAHYWNFNDSAGGDAPWPEPVEATQGDGSITYSFAPENLDDFGGTSDNAQGGDPAGDSFSVVGQSQNGEHFDLNVSTAGLEAIEIAYATRGTDTGFDTHTVSYSTDGGGSFEELDTFTDRNDSSWDVLTADLSGIDAANDNPDLVIRITVDGASSGSGNNRFDNITVSGFSEDDAPPEGVQPIVDVREDARNAGSGEVTATIQGTVTRARGDFAYLQDATAGMTVRQPNGDFADDVADGTIAEGTEVELTGTISFFQGLTQINEDDLQEYEIVSQGNALPAPQLVTLDDIASDGQAFKAQLLQVVDMNISASTSTFESGTNYDVSDGSGSDLELRIPNESDTALDGQPIPPAEATFTGVLSQFNGAGPGEVFPDEGYQLMGIEEGDLEATGDPGDDPDVVSIEDARAESDGTQVTVEGIATRSRGRYVRIQDETAGIVIFDSDADFSDTVVEGDSIRITSTLSTFNEARQLDTPPDDLLILSRNNDLPDPQEITLNELNSNGEAYEAQLVQVEDVTFDTDDLLFTASTSYDISDPTDTGEFRLQQDRDTALDGEPIPQEPFTYQGIVGRFNDVFQLEGVNIRDVSIGDPIDTADALICQIQGTGFTTPAEDLEVTTRNNVVTVLADNGFYMQMTEREDECADQASRGLFVFTGGSPSVNPGDLVDITATAVDFNGSTQLAEGPDIEVVGSASIPDPVTFDANTPSTGPQIVPDLYRYQSMLVRVEDGITTSATDNFGTFYVDAGGELSIERTYRQPGIAFPGQEGIPVWDGNQQLFQIDAAPSDLPSSFDVEVPRGVAVNVAEGPLTFAFGEHVLWPTELDVDAPESLDDFEDQVVSGARELEGDEFSIATFNLFDLFGPGDGDSTPGGYADRLDKQAVYICDLMQAPTMLGIQEVGSQSTLEDLADAIEDECGVSYGAYTPADQPSNFTTAALVQSDVENVTTQGLGADETFGGGSRVHDRVPFLVQGTIEAEGENVPMSMLVLHNRSRIGIEDPSNQDFVIEKRLAQSESVAQMVQDFQENNPGLPLAVVGDFNAFEFTDGYVDVLGEIQGTVTPGDQLLEGNVEVSPPLTNQVTELPPKDRYSFVFEGAAQVLDHVLTNQALDAGVTYRSYIRANSDAPSSSSSFIGDANTTLRSSDHDAMVTYISPSELNLELLSVDVERSFDDPASSASYRLVGLPGNADVDLAETLTGTAGPDWRAFRETGEAEDEDAFLEEYDGSDAFAFRPGRGFWVIAQDNWSFTGEITTFTGSNGSLSVPIQEGWNIVSNPLDSDVDWSAVQNENSTNAPLWQWDGTWSETSTFSSATSGEAYYLLNEDGLDELAFPDNANQAQAPQADATEADEHLLGPLHLTATVDDTPVSGVSVAFDPERSETQAHRAPPAHFETTGTVRFAEGDGEHAHMVVPTHVDAHTFDLVVRGTPGATATLQIDDMETLTTSEGTSPDLRLIDDGGREHDLRTGSVSVVLDEEDGTADLTLQIGALDSIDEALPERLEILSNYPNPFQGQTTLEYTVPESMDIEIVVYNVLGQRVATLESGTQSAGTHQLGWDGRSGGSSLASGVYFVRISGNGETDTQRVTIVR